jgi:hypothetical protein
VPVALEAFVALLLVAIEELVAAPPVPDEVPAVAGPSEESQA